MHPTKKDTLWKGILEDFFRQFLSFFFEEAEVLFDMKRPFEFLDKEIAHAGMDNAVRHPVFVDMLVKVYKHHTDDFVLFHIEVQGSRSSFFSLRMFRYFIRLFNKYQKQIGSHVIFTDKSKLVHPASYSYNFFGTVLTFRYDSYAIAAQSETVLNRDKNPLAFIFLTVLLAHKKNKIADVDLLRQKIVLGEKLFRENWTDSQKFRLLYFLKNYIHFDNNNLNCKFNEAIQFIAGKKTTNMGMIEVITQHAEDQANIKTALNMIKKGFKISIIHEVTGVPLKDVKWLQTKYKKSVLSGRPMNLYLFGADEPLN
ncbi:MAG: hypothetical protein H7Y03_11630 [Chitinophagaceae bacterium]|nr:hypothetical protein [Chitinophagaceae bacterium]